jgi:hypothetical protein
MSEARAALAAEFTNGEVRQFQGRGGQTFDYIEDETVMDRLDDVIGVGHWSIQVEPISVADGIVKVRLGVDGKAGWVYYEDFGYSSNASGEQLKEAVSDGIRRCGRYLGVGRYLYKKHTTRQNGSGRPAPQRPPLRAVSAPASAPDDPFGDDLMGDFPVPTDKRPTGGDASVCELHGEEWRGTPGDLYHKKAEGGYCRHPENVQKPARAR